MRWRNPEDLPPIPSDLESVNQLFERPLGSQAERDRDIYDRRRDGGTYGEIASEFGLSGTQVREIVGVIAGAIRRRGIDR